MIRLSLAKPDFIYYDSQKEKKILRYNIKKYDNKVIQKLERESKVINNYYYPSQ